MISRKSGRARSDRVVQARQVDERPVEDPHAQVGVEDQHAVVDRVEHHLPLAQALLLDLDRGVAEAAQRLRHPADLVAARRGQGCAQVAAGDRQHAVG